MAPSGQSVHATAGVFFFFLFVLLFPECFATPRVFFCAVAAPPCRACEREEGDAFDELAARFLSSALHLFLYTRNRRFHASAGRDLESTRLLPGGGVERC